MLILKRDYIRNSETIREEMSNVYRGSRKLLKNYWIKIGKRIRFFAKA